MIYEELFKIFFIVGIETVGFYYLSNNNLFQIFCSATILIYLAFGVCTFDKRICKFSLLDALICIPYVSLMVNYLIWDSLLRISTNILVILLSCIGLYSYVNTKCLLDS